MLANFTQAIFSRFLPNPDWLLHCSKSHYYVNKMGEWERGRQHTKKKWQKSVILSFITGTFCSFDLSCESISWQYTGHIVPFFLISNHMSEHIRRSKTNNRRLKYLNLTQSRKIVKIATNNIEFIIKVPTTLYTRAHTIYCRKNVRELMNGRVNVGFLLLLYYGLLICDEYFVLLRLLW